MSLLKFVSRFFLHNAAFIVVELTLLATGVHAAEPAERPAEAHSLVGRYEGVKSISPRATPDYVIYFDTGKATWKPESQPVIDDMVRSLKKNQMFGFNVVGHADSTGDDAHNQALSVPPSSAVRVQALQVTVFAALGFVL
jgi:outer membrane protein OmpA-like peptidoglycan-associated protein